MPRRQVSAIHLPGKRRKFTVISMAPLLPVKTSTRGLCKERRLSKGLSMLTPRHTPQMFMPMCTSATRQEHQKRPPSGKASNRPRPQSASKDVRELVEWANSDDINVQFQAARSLADLAMSDFARDAIRTAGGIPPLVKLLCSDMDEVRRCVVTAIANLALSEESQALLAQEENLLSPLISIAASVCNETDDEEMKLNVARCLANLAYCNEKVEADVVELGCLDPLMAMCSSGSPDVRLEAMAALANLARNEGNQRKIVEQGALGHLVAVMKHPEEDEELLKQAARCLANVSLNVYNEKEVKVSLLSACCACAIH
jgi:hypothetical protein